jgi:fatty acid desaturase
MTIISTRPTADTERVKSIYADLSTRIRDAGLLKKNVPFYMRKFIGVTVLSLITWAGVLLLAGTPWALLLAPVIGILTAQYGFLAHESAHKQVFNSNKANKWFALITANLFVGLSYGWWDKKKHSLHHANPNTVGRDPDITIPVLAFTSDDYDAKARGPVMGFLTRHQGYLFPFLLLFTMFDLLANSVRSLLSKSAKLDSRWLELGLIALRIFVPLAALLFLFNPFIAVGFVLIQMAVTGLFMGGAFAPNHKGMPIIPKDLKVDYLRRQVLTSRDIRSNWLVDNLMGGLNYQIEHHLFPSMPRPSLRKAQAIVREFCAEHNISYVETGLFESYNIVMKYLNRVGLRDSDPFSCPMTTQFRQLA